LYWQLLVCDEDLRDHIAYSARFPWKDDQRRLRPLEQVLAVLIDAGFPPVTALRLYRAYFALLYGYVLNELQETVVDPEESRDLLRLGLRRLPPTDFVHIRSLESELGNYDGLAELELGLELLFTGIHHTVNTPAS
jgi:hypothetical protein